MRPTTTFFMLQSLDGKISTGPSPFHDVDKDFPEIPATAPGLHKYYELEKLTDLWSLNTGLTMAKCGVNTRKMPNEPFVNFVVLDNRHLDINGVKWLCGASIEKCVILTSNKNHPAYDVENEKLTIICYEDKVNLKDAFERLYDMGCKELTLQCGSSTNATLFKEKLVDYINIVIAPIVIGGSNVPSLVGGTADENGMNNMLTGLKLIECNNMGDGYINLRYEAMP